MKDLKKEIGSAFKDIFKAKAGNELLTEKEETNLAWNWKTYLKTAKQEDLSRRLTIPLTRKQEKLLEDIIFQIHQNRRKKDQRMTKATIIRTLISLLSGFYEYIDYTEIKDEKAFTERCLDFLKVNRSKIQS